MCCPTYKPVTNLSLCLRKPEYRFVHSAKSVIFEKNAAMSHYKADIVINKDEHGYFAYCPALPGCVTQGESYEETIAYAREAVSLYLSTMSEEEIKDALSQEIVTTSVDVQVA